MRRSADDYRPPETRLYGQGRRPADAAPEDRPGVPREADPEAAERTNSGEPPAQPGREERSTRAALERATPVFGTAQPYRGTSGRMRRLAYSIPEHRVRHWLLLLAADRVDVLEDRIGGVMGRMLGAIGLKRAGRRVREDPLPVVLGAAAGMLLARGLLKDG